MIYDDDYKQCYECEYYRYDTLYDEEYCVESQGKDTRQQLISGDDIPCEYFEDWKEKERQKLKQKLLFDLQGHVCNGSLTINPDDSRNPNDHVCTGCSRYIVLSNMLKEKLKEISNDSKT